MEIAPTACMRSLAILLAPIMALTAILGGIHLTSGAVTPPEPVESTRHEDPRRPASVPLVEVEASAACSVGLLRALLDDDALAAHDILEKLTARTGADLDRRSEIRSSRPADRWSFSNGGSSIRSSPYARRRCWR